ncbi:SGNH/GDSL hydrolase family protein [Aeromicrobium sp.]|uniref:SGNH/GDSL hydrolase family protein n=1 Tax=Aeromicrobium sp. TaxID=1871063 RepID=UPI0019C7ED27|nr:SGNH/GDSL hydrolase family protein [Aeromicrobium sp.]MBC7630275.1 SGNH/GDSL hydrolase family protein [Aeromicrobium sp.]
MSSHRPVLVAMIAIGLLMGCSSAQSGRPDGGDGGTYVALGDSFVSGPGIDDQDVTSPSCFRSNHNYASLVAQSHSQQKFVDVSCGGATTDTVSGPRTMEDGVTIGPQLDAVTTATQLVTIGVGANDAGATAGLFTYCLLPATATDAMCQEFASTYMPTVYDASRDRVSAIVEKVRAKAPKARIVLVGYLRIVPEEGQCATLPLTETRRAAAFMVESSLNSMLRDAAARSDVDFVDVRGASRGHDVCAGRDAWVNGIANVPGDGAYLHPNGAGMDNVADVVLGVLADR